MPPGPFGTAVSGYMSSFLPGPARAKRARGVLPRASAGVSPWASLPIYRKGGEKATCPGPFGTAVKFLQPWPRATCLGALGTFLTATPPLGIPTPRIGMGPEGPGRVATGVSPWTSLPISQQAPEERSPSHPKLSNRCNRFDWARVGGSNGGNSICLTGILFPKFARNRNP